MGWASAGEIFDPVARALIEVGADEQTKRNVLGPLIEKLQAGDWDTEDESIDEFSDDPVIVSLFMERGVRNEADGAAGYGTIEYLADANQWKLFCSACCATVDVRPGTPQGHDELVRLWASHDAESHGGDGEVPEWMLIKPVAS